MSFYLQTCPVQELYQVQFYRPQHQLNITGYRPPPTCLENLDLYSPYNPNTKRTNSNPAKAVAPPAKSKRGVMAPIQTKPKLKLILPTKSFERPDSKLPTISNTNSPIHHFGKESKTLSYLLKDNLQRDTCSPGAYDLADAFNAMAEQCCFNRFPHVNKEDFRRRSHSEDIMARSLEVPGAGQYNINYVPAVKLNCRNSKWATRPSTAQVKKQIEKLKQRTSAPSPLSYNAFPRSYSLFSTLKIKEKQTRAFQAYNKKVKEKEEREKKQKKHNKDAKKHVVGPRKYLNLDNLKDRFNDKKGENFVAKARPPSIYH